MRTAEITRKTNETDITLSLNIDGRGIGDISTGCGFLDHMLTLFAKHGGFDIKLACKGDTYIDYHHTTEDIGIALGNAFYAAMGDKMGICRYGDCILPMDEALIMTAVDISGRAFLGFSAPIPTEKVGDFDTELVLEFFRAFTANAGITAHIRELSGENSHHIIEGIFKSFARSLSAALKKDEKFSDEIPSTKGII